MNDLSGKMSSLIFSILLLTTFIIAASDVSAANSPSLGTASNFAVLGATEVTNIPTSAITGDVGLSPATGSNYAGLTAAQVTGTIYAVDAFGPAGSVSNPGLLTTAKADLVTAYGNLGSQACDTPYSGTKDLSGLSLGPGVYCADAFTLSGTLNLTGSGVWVFKSTSTLITSGTAKVVGGDACNVWWWVASSATLGTGTQLTGNILALTSIGMDTGATLNGRAMVQTAAVTLHMNNVNPTCANANINKIITISKSFNTSTAQPGDIVNVTLNVTNNGTSTINPIKVVDVLPNQLTFDDSASPVQSSIIAQTVIWDNVGPLSSGASKIITFLAQVNSNATTGIVGNFANATGSSSEKTVSDFNTTNLSIQPVIAAPTATGPWPYFLVLTFGIIAAWSLSPTFVKVLSLNSRSLKRDFNGIRKQI